MALGEMARALWAKSGTGDGDDWHPLIAHLLDVAACAMAILEREPLTTRRAYAADLGLDEAPALAWVGALAGLHDLGKASPAFQQKWPPGKERVWAAGLTWVPAAAPTSPPNDVPHSVISQLVLAELLRAAGWRRRAAKRAADAVGAHHGFRALHRELARAELPAETGDERWAVARQELFATVLAVVGVTPSSAPGGFDGAAHQRLAGLTSFADWIGSGLPRAPLGDDLAAYFRAALAGANRALDDIGWTARAPLLADPGRSLAEVFAYLGRVDAPFQTRRLQALLEEMVAGATGPTLFLIEAPMGEGKTEAALYAHLRLQAVNGHRGLYVALPTQATGNAMFERLQNFLARCPAVGARPPIDLQLLHGATLLNPTFQALVIRSNLPSGHIGAAGSADTAEEGVRAGEWFTHRKRALLSEYGVGTIDQALLAILPTKHQFVRLWGLANRVVVLDEVHAYDTYTGTLIEELVRWLRALGSSVILMTATLPDDKRQALLEAWGSGSAELAAYPRITRVSGGQVASQTFQGRDQPTLRLAATPADIPALAQKLSALVRDGGCAACIVNTVQRAQDLYAALRALGRDGNATLAAMHAAGDLLLFHARFPTDERFDRERAVLAAFGEERAGSPARRPARAILIATQVVEQSLDLDFDVMMTDLAPIDLVLQRAGRLHRHRRAPMTRHGHSEPVLYLAGPAADGSVPDFGVSQMIYERYVLLRTWLAIQGRDQIALPADIDRLVRVVYTPSEPAGLGPEWQEALRTARVRQAHQQSEAGVAATHAAFGRPNETDWLDMVPRERYPDDADPRADDDPPLTATRLGRPTVTVIPIHADGDHYWLDASRARRVRFTSGDVGRDEAIRLYQRSVRLSHPEIERRIEASAQAERIDLGGWRKSPLLARCWPLVLRDGRAVIGRQAVRLDPELGIVYEHPAREQG